jgi:uncharacterized protein YdbL (DUF1318 family)
MQARKTGKIISIAIFFLLFCSLNAQAESGKAIMARMKARLPEINKLKTSGIIGENSEGFLAFVGKSQNGGELLKAENTDRKKVYTAIARQQGTEIKLVGQRRAMQIAKKAKPGTWLQDSKGKWHQK